MNPARVAALRLGLQRHDHARRTGASRAARTVQVGLVLGRRVDVHDECDLVDVDAAGGDVGGDEDADFAGLGAFEIEFDNPAVAATGSQFVFDMGSGKYKKEIARARTFGMTADIDLMRSRGLTLGGAAQFDQYIALILEAVGLGAVDDQVFEFRQPCQVHLKLGVAPVDGFESAAVAGNAKQHLRRRAQGERWALSRLPM